MSRTTADDAAPPPLSPLDLLRVLSEHGVEFVVIGGFSLAAHGVIRGTKDLDIVPDPSRPNLERLASALKDLEAEVLLAADFEAAESGIELDADGLQQGGNWVLQTKHGRLDIMQFVAGVKSYDQLRAGALAWEVPSLDKPPCFAGLDDLVAMKQAAGRNQDLLDIADLERARGATE